MSDSKTIENLKFLYEWYDTGYAVQTSLEVAEKVSACDEGKEWKWRYLLSIKNTQFEPRPRISKAINKEYDRIIRILKKSSADAEDTARLFPVQVVLTRSQYDEVLAIEDTKLRGQIFIEAVRNYNMVQRVLKLKEKK